jgi:hypothetical protein
MRRGEHHSIKIVPLNGQVLAIKHGAFNRSAVFSLGLATPSCPSQTEGKREGWIAVLYRIPPFPVGIIDFVVIVDFTEWGAGISEFGRTVRAFYQQSAALRSSDMMA